MNPPAATPDPDPLEDLLAEALDRLQEGGSGALIGFLDTHPDEKAELSTELERLRALGLIEAPPAELGPERVGDFRLVRRIGSGGMGVVHEAEQVSLGRRVAVKLVRPELVFFDQSRERFRREVEAASRLAHPGIAQVFAVGEESGLPWFAMELVDGVGLDVLLGAFEGRDPRRLRGADLAAELERRLGPRTGSSSVGPGLFSGSWFDVALRLARQVAEALEHAHGRGVVHRDIKPSNVLVTRTGRAILVDFGLALTEEASRITRTNTQPGSLPYMSPEQLAGEHVGARADVYSLGVTLYELLVLKPAFAGPIEQVRANISSGHCEPLPRALPADLRTVVATAMERDAHRRYASAGDLARDLGNLLAHRPIDARTPSLSLRLVRWGQRRPRLAAAALTAVLGGLAVSLFFLQRERDHTRELDRAAVDMRRELKRSRLERGALLVQLGALEAAESVLWPELLEAPDSEEALWALRNLYHRFPCLATGHIKDSNLGLTRTLLEHPDGLRILSASEDGGLRVHDRASLAQELVGQQGAGWQDAALSVEDNRLYHLGTRLDVYQLDSLQLLASFEGPEFQGAAVAALPAGGGALLGGVDGALRLFDPQIWSLAGELAWHRNVVTDVGVAPDGRIVSVDADGQVYVLEGPSSPPVLVLETSASLVNVGHFSPDGCRLVAGGRNVARIWDALSGRELHELRLPNGNLRACVFTADESELLTGGWWALDRWSLADGKWVRLFGLQTDGLLPLEAQRVWAAAHGPDLRLWERRAILGPTDLDVVTGPPAVRFSRDGRHLFVSANSGAVRIWDLDGRRLERELGAHSRRTNLVLGSFAAEGFWTCSTDGSARLWHPDRPDPIAELTDLEVGPYSAMDLSADGAHIATGCLGGRIRIRDGRSGELQSEFQVTNREFLSVRLSADGRRVACTSRDGRVYVNELDGTPVAAIDCGWTPLALALHADGRRLAVSSWASQVSIFDLEERESAQQLIGHSGTVWDLRFRPGHPDQLATSSGDGTVRLWDMDTGRLLFLIDEFGGQEAATVDFDPSGRWLAATSTDGRVRLIDLNESLRCVAGNLEHQLALHGSGSDLDFLRRRLAEPGTAR